jgi:hypothetical protein
VARIGYQHGDERQTRSDHADDHQDDPDLVHVESVLVRAHSHGKIQNGPYRKRDNACDKSSGSNHCKLLSGRHRNTRMNALETGIGNVAEIKRSEKHRLSQLGSWNVFGHRAEAC